MSLKAARSAAQLEKSEGMGGCGRQEQALLDVYAAEGWRGAKKDAVRPLSELARAAKQVGAARVLVQGLVSSLVLGPGRWAHTPHAVECLTQGVVKESLRASTSCKPSCVGPARDTRGTLGSAPHPHHAAA